MCGVPESKWRSQVSSQALRRVSVKLPKRGSYNEGRKLSIGFTMLELLMGSTWVSSVMQWLWGLECGGLREKWVIKFVDMDFNNFVYLNKNISSSCKHKMSCIHMQYSVSKKHGLKTTFLKRHLPSFTINFQNWFRGFLNSAHSLNGAEA